MAKAKSPGLLLIGLGSMLTSMVVAGFVLGYLTDRWLGTEPIFMVSFGVLGFVGGVLKVYKLLSNPDFQ
jgi:ATP synthase protein I